MRSLARRHMCIYKSVSDYAFTNNIIIIHSVVLTINAKKNHIIYVRKVCAFLQPANAHTN